MKIKPKKSLGQNFLRDNTFIEKILTCANLPNANEIIEIGPGKVLSGMVKRTVKIINCFSINSIDDMKKTIDESKK